MTEDGASGPGSRFIDWDTLEALLVEVRAAYTRATEVQGRDDRDDDTRGLHYQVGMAETHLRATHSTAQVLLLSEQREGLVSAVVYLLAGIRVIDRRSPPPASTRVPPPTPGSLTQVGGTPHTWEVTHKAGGVSLLIQTTDRLASRLSMALSRLNSGYQITCVLRKMVGEADVLKVEEVVAEYVRTTEAMAELADRRAAAESELRQAGFPRV